MSSAEQVLVANAGTIHVFHAAAELQRHGLLRRCATSLYVKDDAFSFLPAGIRASLLQATANRRCADLDGAVETLPWPELVCLAAKKLGVGSAGRLIEWRNRRFCVWAADHCLQDVGLVWAFDTSSYELFVTAKKRGMICVLDMTIAHPALGSRLMSEYARKRPSLARCMDLSVADGAIERRRAEIDLADRISVPSSFVRDSLLEEGVRSNKIFVNPYGVDLELFRPGPDDKQKRSALRFLFVGWFSGRKGIYDLFEAWELSGLFERGAELIVAGGTRKDLNCWPGQLPRGVTILGPVAHPDLPALYRSADVFVFPSLFEGSAKTVLEAMASGLPVVTTPEACDEHWVVHGENGFRLVAGEPVMLAKRMCELAGDAALRTQMGARAVERARRHSWSTYGDRCAALCRELLGAPTC